MRTVIDGIDINYDFRGKENPSDTLVVLLHGWGSNIKLFDNLMSVVSKKYPVAALDMPGFGETPEPCETWGSTPTSLLSLLKASAIKK